VGADVRVDGVELAQDGAAARDQGVQDVRRDDGQVVARAQDWRGRGREREGERERERERERETL